jgi:hypothetical protein
MKRTCHHCVRQSEVSLYKGRKEGQRGKHINVIHIFAR